MDDCSRNEEERGKVWVREKKGKLVRKKKRKLHNALEEEMREAKEGAFFFLPRFTYFFLLLGRQFQYFSLSRSLLASSSPLVRKKIESGIVLVPTSNKWPLFFFPHFTFSYIQLFS